MLTFNKECFVAASRKHKTDYFKNFPNDTGFAIDGPNDCEAWMKTEWRILFLLRETYGGVCEEFICIDSEEYNKPFTSNNFYSNKTNRVLARVAYGLNKILSGVTHVKTTGISQTELAKAYARSATIELKKSTNTKSKKSNLKEAQIRAQFSAEFIDWQIQQLDPHIIVCCGKDTHQLLVGCVLNKTTHKFQILESSKHFSAPGFHVDSLLTDFQSNLGLPKPI